MSPSLLLFTHRSNWNSSALKGTIARNQPAAWSVAIFLFNPFSQSWRRGYQRPKTSKSHIQPLSSLSASLPVPPGKHAAPNSPPEPRPLPHLDHSDPSKPSHRLTNGPKPSKTIESDGSKTKNHWKTIDGNGQTAKKHSMVIFSSKTIENLQWLLQNHWNLQCFPKNRWTCQWSSQINILLKEWNYPVVTITILIWLFCSKVWVSRPWYLLLRIAVENETCLIPLIILHAFI